MRWEPKWLLLRLEGELNYQEENKISMKSFYRVFYIILKEYHLICVLR